MNSTAERVKDLLRGHFPGNIVARTTVAILGLSLLLGLLFSAIVWKSIHAREEQRAEARLGELFSTVESTARIACFLNDRTLAKEIGTGLMSNRSVSGVRIAAGSTTLYHDGRAVPARAHVPRSRLVMRPVYSPFDPKLKVGEISLYLAADQIAADTSTYSREVTLLLAVQVVLLGAGVALAVFFFVTQPIRRVSNALHTTQVRAGTHLEVPPRHKRDEIGRLVRDVNVLISDLTGLLATERELRMEHEVSERRMRLIFEKSATGLFVLNSEGMVLSCNPAFGRILGLSAETHPNLRGSSFMALIPAHAQTIVRVMRESTRSGSPGEIDLRLSPEGALKEHWIEISLRPIGHGSLQGVVNDISERKHAEITARRLASHDVLTGLLNRHGLDVALRAAFSRTTPGETPSIALMQIDLDYFKQVNDTYGHEAGDRVLRYVAQVLKRCVRSGDFVARPGGDEFTAALVGVTSAAKVEEIGARMIDGISQPIDIGEGRYAHIGASIGIAFALTADDNASVVMRRADANMYNAKQSGRGQVRVA